MGYINEVRRSASIHDLFMDAARHYVSNNDSHYGHNDFTTAYLEIERSPRMTIGRDYVPVDFSFGSFDVLWMGSETIDKVEYGCFFFRDRYDAKRTVRHTEWVERELADLLFECCTEFMQVCIKLKNGEIQPYTDDDKTEPWDWEDEESNA